MARCESVRDQGGEGANHWYHVVIREGRNREVRRLFDALGLRVSRLMRVRFGTLVLPRNLRRGQYLEMAPRDIRQLLGELGIEPISLEAARGERSARPRHQRRRAR